VLHRLKHSEAFFGLVCSIALLSFPRLLPAQNTWQLDSNGGITWKVEPNKSHEDHIEMSGRKVSVIITYSVDEGGDLKLSRNIIFPMLRFHPNETRDHFGVMFADDATPRILINRNPLGNEKAVAISHHGMMRTESLIGRNNDLVMTRTIFPSVDKPLVVERVTFSNTSKQDVTIELDDTKKTVRTPASKGIYGAYVASSKVINFCERILRPGDSGSFAVVYTARRANEEPLVVNPEAEEQSRAQRVAGILEKLQLQTPDPILNTEFSFAKIRSAESVYKTRDGPMLGPGGGQYYAAIWANDQAEYANPFFPFLGDELANDSAINSFRQFARFINPEYKPIPSSIISEGAGFWNGAGDRGDMAMIAYGAGRFALAFGRKDTAEHLWPLIKWCLEYCRRKVNDQGVVASDSDELEGRFPSGKANLHTSVLYYDALNSAAMLGEELGKPNELLQQYADRASSIRMAIDKYFGRTVDGFDTYRYYNKNDLIGESKFSGYADKPDVLRAWISSPLTAGIFERKDATLDALFTKLWIDDGFATEEGNNTIWDRSTLYTLRATFIAGDTERGLDYLSRYSRSRLLGDHVPYPIEVYPKSGQQQLAAESALYARVFTEGLFGLRPTGLHSFRCAPRLPKTWNQMSLINVHAFGTVFDLIVRRGQDDLKIDIYKRKNLIVSRTIKETSLAPIDIQL
jgi:hypothetical protein